MNNQNSEDKIYKLHKLISDLVLKLTKYQKNNQDDMLYKL